MKLLSFDGQADLGTIGQMRKSLRSALAPLRLDYGAANDLLLAFSELATNVVRHGKPSATMLSLDVEIRGRWLRLAVTDDGGPFQQFEDYHRAAYARDVWEHKESGLGMPLVLDAMNYVNYSAGPPNTIEAWQDMFRRRPVALLFDANSSRLEQRAPVLRSCFKLIAATDIGTVPELAMLAPLDLAICPEGCASSLKDAIAEAGQPDVPIAAMADDCEDAAEALRLAVCRLAEQSNAEIALSEGFLRHGAAAVTGTSGLEAIAAVGGQPASFAAATVFARDDADDARLIMLEDLRFGPRGATGLAEMSKQVAAAGIARDKPAGRELLSRTLANAVQPGAPRSTAVTLLDLSDPAGLQICTNTFSDAFVLNERAEVRPVAMVAFPGTHRTMELKIAAGEHLVIASEGLGVRHPRDPAQLPSWLTSAVTAAASAPADVLGGHLSSALERNVPGGSSVGAVVVVRRLPRPASV